MAASAAVRRRAARRLQRSVSAQRETSYRQRATGKSFILFSFISNIIAINNSFEEPQQPLGDHLGSGARQVAGSQEGTATEAAALMETKGNLNVSLEKIIV